MTENRFNCSKVEQEDDFGHHNQSFRSIRVGLFCTCRMKRLTNVDKHYRLRNKTHYLEFPSKQFCQVTVFRFKKNYTRKNFFLPQ